MNPFTKKIPFAKPSIGCREVRAVNKVLRSGWLTSGRENQLFEKEFSDFLDIDYALSVNSATAGLHLALEALNIKKGDQVLTSAYTFTASAEIISYCGAEPVLVDIEEDYNISAEAIKQKLNSKDHRIKAVIVVHIAGNSCDMDRIVPLCHEHNIAVIEDCAHAFPVNYGERKLGTLGDIGVFSFYANKTITTGEGGMVVCKNKEYYQRMKIMRLHGIDRDIWNRYSHSADSQSWKYDVTAAGYKYNLTNFQAALGRVQLKRAEKLKQRRTRLAQLYRNALWDSKVFSLAEFSGDHSWHLFMVQLPDQLKRDSLCQFLHEKGIGTSVHFIPLPCFSYYQKSWGISPHDFPVSIEKYHRSLSIPLFADLTRLQQKYILKQLFLWESSHG